MTSSESSHQERQLTNTWITLWRLYIKSANGKHSQACMTGQVLWIQIRSWCWKISPQSSENNQKNLRQKKQCQDLGGK